MTPLPPDRWIPVLAALSAVLPCLLGMTTAVAAGDVDASDSGAVFRIKAPRAQKVELRAQWNRWQAIDMTRGSAGEWSVTVPDLPAGIWEYHFTVDGLNVLDPHNPAIKPQRNPQSSIWHAPSAPPAPWDERRIPHGVLHAHRYFSKTLGIPREVVVYTPPGYSPTSAPLPALYLSHGYSDNQRTWSMHGKAQWIADALIAEGRAAPMLIIMPDAHALPPENKGDFDDYAPANTAAFIRELREDVRPLVEGAYRCRTDADGRAFAGLSMGGYHALTLALTRSDEFAWVAAFSAAPPKRETVQAAFDAPDAVNTHLKLFWIPIGRNDFLLSRLTPFVDTMKAAGLRPEFVVTEGDHSWPVWRQYLAELLPRLFR